MAVASQLYWSLTGTVAAWIVFKALKFAYRHATSSLRNLPGPKNTSLIYGNMKEIWAGVRISNMETWRSRRRLYTTDLNALNHILMNNEIYEKPETVRYTLTRLLGAAGLYFIIPNPGKPRNTSLIGLLVVEGDKHKQQRKVMNPAFGPSQIRELTEIFVTKALELRQRWASQIAREDGQSRIDVLSWLTRATLDIIGLAGFNYNIDALGEDGKENELSSAFAVMFRANVRMSLIPVIRTFVPLLRFLETDQDKRAAKAKSTMARIGNELLRESKTMIHDKNTARDLLSLLVKSNMRTDTQEHQRMTDEDVLAQIPTFLVAGHETTSTSTTWALFALAQNQAIQAKLRQELNTIDTDNPTMDQLNSLPYLDMVIRETLRIHSPTASTMRIAVKDDILPLGRPVVDKKGVKHDTIKVRKGETFLVPILAINRSKDIWGEDAREYRPERWENVPEAATHIPGAWSNILTFLGGPRACIGWRFSVVETKALLFTLVRAFEFELAVPASDIEKKGNIVLRPVLVTDGSNQMPLFVRPVATN
ncbi:hypothetical protein H0H92_011393 [Tricholoma furcatifolium]|nr:hypothetical protein H0H92_011393 [Tricholoma furcatifolium]